MIDISKKTVRYRHLAHDIVMISYDVLNKKTYNVMLILSFDDFENIFIEFFHGRFDVFDL
jgi:hypothetical protein